MTREILIRIILFFYFIYLEFKSPFIRKIFIFIDSAYSDFIVQTVVFSAHTDILSVNVHVHLLKNENSERLIQPEEWWLYKYPRKVTTSFLCLSDTFFDTLKQVVMRIILNV